MKKAVLLLAMSFVFSFALTAQITQQQADSIVLNRLSSETKDYTLYAKEGIQTGITITTSAEEALELDYPCWVYYVTLDFGRYLIVKESNGNLLEINPKKNTAPNDLTEWREVTEETPPLCEFETPLSDLLWLKEIIEQFEEDAETTGHNPHAQIYQCSYKGGTGFLLEMCVGCPDTGYSFRNCEGEILCAGEQLEENSCSELEIDFAGKKVIWEMEEIIKINYPIEIPFEEYSLTFTPCQWANIVYPDKFIIINNNEELESYINCSTGNYPEINFSTHTLLVATGTGRSTIHTFEKQLQQISINEYSLYVDVKRGSGAMPESWFVSIKIPKLSKNDVITININDGYGNSGDTTAKIMRELPKMYLKGNLTAGEHTVIQSQVELLSIFSQEEIDKSSDLQEIDLNTQTLLIGRDNYCAAAAFNYEFSLSEKNQYTFTVDIFGNWAVMDYNFLYGIVISKLPEHTKVVFNINKEFDCHKL